VTEIFWFRELESAGKGPDWVFNATFAPGSRHALAATLLGHAPVGFTAYHASQRPCSIHGTLCDYVEYIDTAHYQACVDQLEGRNTNNIYIFHTIQVCQNEFQLVRGYGGDPAQHGHAETQMIRAIAQAPELAMIGWSIVYGGVTYPYETLVSGATPAALLAYLNSIES
jgi:hypothetical protein